MSSAAKLPLAPRYGSAAEVSALTGLSVKTVRRRVKDGSLRGVRLGRRVLIPLDALDRPRTQEAPLMAVAHDPAGGPTTAEVPYVPPISSEELARRNQSAIELLDLWEAEGDEQDHRETMQVLREALGEGRSSSSRNLFP